MKEELTSFHSEKVRKKVDISENVLQPSAYANTVKASHSIKVITKVANKGECSNDIRSKEVRSPSAELC